MSYTMKTKASNYYVLSASVTALLALVMLMPIQVANAHQVAITTQPMDHSKMEGMSGMKEMDGMKEMGGMKHVEGMSMSGDVDYDFAVNMRTHHQMAVKMSQALLKNGRSPKLRTMATTIIDAQKKEIAELDQWLKMNKKPMANTKK